ncbi:MAG TPA: hypothetical protein VH062_03680 [Polyangiaceae bacterium]|nr:hypothetical protein [Polyangiaceae bacterium]
MTGENGAGNGIDHDDEDGEDPYAGVLGDVPAQILELSENCRQFALSAVGVELDYEVETLPILDAYLRVAAAGLKDRPEATPVVTQTVAAYFGEVVRRRMDGFWRHKDDVNDPWELCARRALLSLSPLGVVLEVMAESTEHDGPSGELKLAPDDQRLADERLARIPPVSEEEYYLLSTRQEVIETVYETLRENLKAEGRESIVFEASDYEDD